MTKRRCDKCAYWQHDESLSARYGASGRRVGLCHHSAATDASEEVPA